VGTSTVEDGLKSSLCLSHCSDCFTSFSLFCLVYWSAVIV
jgi:hypothetical protein